MRFPNGLIASMEEIDNALPVDESGAAETAVAVADDSSEIQADGDEIGVSVSEVEDAVQAGEELEDIADVASDAVESGEGLDEKGAELASIAIESIMNRIGFSTTTRLVPVTESFGNSNTRLSSTKLIVESIGDTIKKIWAAIKAGAARLWDKIKAFFISLFNSASGLSKHIQGLKARANALPASVTKKEKTIKTSLAKSFSIKGKADFGTFNEVYKNTDALYAVALKITELSSGVTDAAMQLAKMPEVNEAAIKSFLNAKKSAGAAINSAMDSAFEKAEKSFAGGELNAVMKPPKSKKGATAKVSCYGPFMGGVVLTLTETETDYSAAFGGVSGKTADSVEALERGQIISILDQANKTVNTLQDYKRVQGNMEKMSKGIAQLADTVMSNSAKLLDKTGSSSETRQGLSELKSAVNDTIALLNSFGNRAPGLSFAQGKCAADYASLCIRNLSEK